ncbi:MAG: hypothetical protein DCC55_02010 [Chloroflexi bacterium]|nr:MAG: hypothetical protein DCC55_02010 [Chloroflexota bacterium]
MSTLHLYYLGAPRVLLNGTPVDLGRRTTLALLVYLAVTNHPQSRDAVATLLWPDSGQSQARKALRRDLTLLTKAIGKQWFVIYRDTIALNRNAAPWVDVHDFQQLVEVRAADAQEATKKAIALYRGDFLSGFSLSDSPQFDEWQFFQAENYRQKYAQALEKLVQQHTEQADYPTAIDYARRRLALDPLHEPAHRTLMQLYAWSGQQAAALRQYDECVRLLEEELDAPPEAETVQLYGTIKARRLALPHKTHPVSEVTGPQSDSARKRADTERQTQHLEPQAQPVSPLPTHNLPPQTTSFVGRVEEVLEIRRLLCNEPDCRLVTLSGPGGIGKTRLALAAAQSLLEAPVAAGSTPPFVDGFFFVPLAAVTTAELVVSAIAEALSLTFGGAADRQVQLLNYLRPRGLLLVLDNFEQLHDAADLLSEMLAAAPATKLLVTSRERLNLQEEWGMDVDALAFPQSAVGLQGVELETLAAYGAVQLFIQRARRVQTTFQLDDAAGAHVVRICQLVGGMPLALELAATWLRVLSCREIAQEIAQSLDFLATSLRNIPERHRSLRAVFEQSWQMLSEQERTVFRQLAVFEGGFTREAAQAVAGATLLQLSALVDKSLLRYGQDAAGQGRYEIHELLRQFGAEKLQQVAGEQHAVQERHAEFYTAWLGGLEKGIKSGRQFEVLDAIAADIANVRASWLWAAQQGKVATINRSLLTFERFCHLRGYAQEGATLCLRTLEMLQEGGYPHDPVALHPPLRYETQIPYLLCVRGWLSALLGQLDLANELLGAGIAQLRQLGAAARPHLATFLQRAGSTMYFDGQYVRAHDYLQESLTLFTALADNWGIAMSLLLLGLVAEAQSAFMRAQSLLEEGIQRCDKDGEQGMRAYGANALGRIATVLGDYAQAERLVHEALIVRRRMRDRTGTALSLSTLGYTLQAMGRWAEAAACHQESIDLHLETGNVLWAAFSRNDLANALLEAGQVTPARQLSAESLAIFQQLEDSIGVANCLHNLGKTGRQSEDFATAQRLLRESLALRRTLGNQHHVALSLSELGQAALGMDELQTAQDELHEALAIATELQIAPLMLEILVTWAALLQRQGDEVRAIELLTLAEQHPASTSTTKKNARRLLATATATLPAQMGQAATDRAATLHLQEYVAELLAPSSAPVQ